jgi:predicted RNA binding protein YcfA (HicA-like mRNA interferase family)
MKQRLPRITGKQAINALKRAGFVVVRVEGSHHFLSFPEDPSRWATVPVHGKEILSLKILNRILHTTNLTKDELKRLL